MKVYVVTHCMDCDNSWASAVFLNKSDAEEWVRNQERDDADYSQGAGYPRSDIGSNDIDEFEIRESSDYTQKDIDGLRTNYGVLKGRGFLPPEGSNYWKVVDK